MYIVFLNKCDLRSPDNDEMPSFQNAFCCIRNADTIFYKNNFESDDCISDVLTYGSDTGNEFTTFYESVFHLINPTINFVYKDKNLHISLTWHEFKNSFFKMMELINKNLPIDFKNFKSITPEIKEQIKTLCKAKTDDLLISFLSKHDLFEETIFNNLGVNDNTYYHKEMEKLFSVFDRVIHEKGFDYENYCLSLREENEKNDNHEFLLETLDALEFDENVIKNLYENRKDFKFSFNIELISDFKSSKSEEAVVFSLIDEKDNKIIHQNKMNKRDFSYSFNFEAINEHLFNLFQK